jgi:hypothetical protein
VLIIWLGVRFAMRTDVIITLVFAAILDTAWALALWRHQPEHLYQKNRESRFMWFWLDVFGVPRTQENCVRLVRVAHVAGMVLVTLGSLLVVLFSHR